MNVFLRNEEQVDDEVQKFQSSTIQRLNKELIAQFIPSKLKNL